MLCDLCCVLCVVHCIYWPLWYPPFICFLCFHSCLCDMYYTLPYIVSCSTPQHMQGLSYIVYSEEPHQGWPRCGGQSTASATHEQCGTPCWAAACCLTFSLHQVSSLWQIQPSHLRFFQWHTWIMSSSHVCHLSWVKQSFLHWVFSWSYLG